MTNDEKIALSKQVAELYGIDASVSGWYNHWGEEYEKEWLADNSARCFELAVEYNLDILNYKFGYVSIDSEHILDYLDEEIKDHPSKAEATRIAILKCLVKMKEGVRAQQTNEAFEKWYKNQYGDEGLKRALNHPHVPDGEYVYENTNRFFEIWQAYAEQQPLKRLSDEDVDSYILNKGHLDCVLDFSAEHDDVTELKTELRRLVKAIMDEMERINHE